MEEQDYATYKHFRGMFMEHNNGTTLAETVVVLLPVPLGVVLVSLMLQILSSYSQLLSTKLWVHFLIEFCLLVVPLQLNLTVCSDYVYLLVVIMGLACATLLFPTVKEVWRSGSLLMTLPIREGKRPYITNFRSSVNLATSICILAVDFTLFPRRFAKTQLFGFSLMDVGVGGFIFTNAIVAPEARTVRIEAPCRIIWKAVVSSVPLVVLGILRLVSTRSLDYYVNVTEYGVHWNFFFTLAVCKVSCTVILCVVPAKYSAVFSFLVICVHELLLASGIQEWVLSAAPRDSFLSANREGIISCSGYVALYLAGVYVGRFLHFKRMFLRGYLQLTLELLFASLLSSFVGEIVKVRLGVSRRLANFGYYTLTVAYNLTFLTLFLCIELVTTVFQHKVQQIQTFDRRKDENRQVKQVTFVPFILAGISNNGLLFFMTANLLTGFVNMYIRTIYLPVFVSALLLTLYSFLLCSFVIILNVKGIQLKVW